MAATPGSAGYAGGSPLAEAPGVPANINVASHWPALGQCVTLAEATPLPAPERRSAGYLAWLPPPDLRVTPPEGPLGPWTDHTCVWSSFSPAGDCAWPRVSAPDPLLGGTGTTQPWWPFFASGLVQLRSRTLVRPVPHTKAEVFLQQIW